ncbi:AAA family ATPase, partial [Klebsiella oxytoca]
GNASANPYPSIELRNVRGKDGHIENSILDQLDEILLELETADHTYETIVLDVIDDIVVMIEQYLCDREGVETLGDIPFGKG